MGNAFEEAASFGGFILQVPKTAKITESNEAKKREESRSDQESRSQSWTRENL